MPKLQRKIQSFQAGEITPLMYGRSDTDVYNKGLAVAENVFIDKRGGAIRRGGLQHVAQFDGNNARLFSIQASRTRFYTIIIRDLELFVVTPGSTLIGDNLLTNGDFASGGTGWTSIVTPGTSQVVFRTNQCDLLPETENSEINTNPRFDLGDLGWTERISEPQSTVTFADGTCVLAPRQVAAAYAGIAQEVTTGHAGELHELTITGDFSSGGLSVKVGTVEDDGTYLDTLIEPPGPEGSVTLGFTPAASPFWLTLDSDYPAVVTTLFDATITEPIEKTAAITQEATVTALPTDDHVAIVTQLTREPITLKVGTTSGDNDIAEVSSSGTDLSVTFVPNVASYWVTVEADGNQTAKSSLTFVGTADTTEVSGPGISMPAPWTEDQLDEIHMVESPEGQSFYFTHPNVQVQKLVYSFAGDVFTDLAPVTFTNKPAEWTGTNWPATGTFFQGRLWFGGTPNQRQTIWGSKSNSPEDFDFGTGLDDEAIEKTTREFGRIEWMIGNKNLLIGTENGEHIITSDGPVLTPTDSFVEQQSTYGSNNMQAIQVGEKVLYLTPDGRKLRAMAYQWGENNWLSDDLTFASEHITEGIGKHGTWAQHPNNIFAIVMEDGTLATLTYDRTGQTIGWTRMVVPDFHIIDVTSGRSNGINQIVVVGQRTNGKLDLETNAGGLEYLDSYASASDPVGTNIIDGLDHLEGELVRPIVDGAVEPLKLVVGGQITTENTGKELHAGKDYTSTIITLPPDVQQEQIRSWKKRWNKVWALMVDSKQPLINGTRPPERTPSTPMDTVEPDRNTLFKSIDLGWDENGQITIQQDLPVAMKVLAIYGELGAESL